MAVPALVVTLIGLGSWFFNLPASLITIKFGERWAIVAAGAAGAVAVCRRRPPEDRAPMASPRVGNVKRL
ncbi:hypothetical protein GCM10023346_02920 [Arthrobacter gyeryongensis]|uniref:Uncharacterized protein n=1 Tax=Arthrobacter gyeryongensis TaxID=1650592 RepID=A0ABP9RZT9_9MICC